MVVLFSEIHSYIDSHPMIYSLTKDHLDEKFWRKVSEQKYVTFDDTTKYCEAKWRYAYPELAAMYAGELLNKVRVSYNLWLNFRKEIDQTLSSKGWTWGDIDQALSIFSKAPNEIHIPDVLKFSEIATFAYNRAYFYLYSIPLSLGVIAPFIDPENAPRYSEEGQKAHRIIVLAHLWKRYEERWEGHPNRQELIERVDVMRKIVDEIKSGKKTLKG
jgi:hypothetical protein